MNYSRKSAVGDNISGLIRTGYMLIFIAVEHTMGTILVTQTIYFVNLMSSSNKTDTFFPNSVFAYCYC